MFFQLFYHMSTAYSFPYESCLEEKAYNPPHDPHKIINLVEIVKESELNEVTKVILGKYPNTYSYTKSLSEGLVNEASKYLPTLIVRPSIVIPTWREPIPGWTDNLNGNVATIYLQRENNFNMLILQDPLVLCWPQEAAY